MLRDSNGSFAATTITLTGNSLVNYSSLGACDTGSGYLWAPTNQNTLIGLQAGKSNSLTGTSNVAVGYHTLKAAQQAFDNVAIGFNAAGALQGGATLFESVLNVTVIAGSENVAIGTDALASTGQGFANVAVGSGALQNSFDNGLGVSGPLQFNVAVGYQALANTQAGELENRFPLPPLFIPYINTAVGSFALSNNISGAANTAVGNMALAANQFGTNNSVLGDSAMSLATASFDVALGCNVLQNDTSIGANTAIGFNAMQNAIPLNGYDVAIGQNALQNDLVGQNIAVGNNALSSLTSGSNNIAIGALGIFGAGSNYTSNETNNIIIGNLGTTGDQNVIRIGTQGTQTAAYMAGIYGVTPAEPDGFVIINNNGQLGSIGSSFLSTLTTATACDTPLTLVLRDNTGSFVATTITLTGNSLINYSDLGICDTGSGFIWAPENQNTIIGLGAGNSNSLTGTSNVALGFGALANITAGFDNIAIGAFALNTYVGNSTFGDNIAIGTNALSSSSEGIANIAIGTNALSSGDAFLENIGIGYNALAISTANDNLAVGHFALFENTSGEGNTAVGNAASFSNSTGENNSAFGTNALASNLTGSGNTAIGYYALLGLGNGDNNTALGNSADVTDATSQNRTAIGANARAFLDNSMMLGDDTIVSVMPGGSKTTDLGYLDPLDVNNQIWATVHTVTARFYDSSNNYASVSAPTAYNNSYNMLLPINQGDSGQLLTTDGNLPNTQLSWTTITALTSVTACDTPLTLVLRDSTGSFAATTITLTGNSLINYSASGACADSQPFIWAPTYQNTLMGIGIITSGGAANTAFGAEALANATGNGNVALGAQALLANTTGSANIGVGVRTLFTNQTGQYNTALGNGADVSSSNAQNRTAVGAGAYALVDNGIALGDSLNITTVYPGRNKAVDLGYLDKVTSNTRIWATVHTVTARFYDSSNNYASFSAPTAYNNSYNMLLPINQGASGQLLTTDGNLANAQLSWKTITALTSVTACDTPLTLVLRDSTGSFAATTITLTGNSLINYSTLGTCDTGSGYIWAPTNQNTIIGLGAGKNNTLTGQNNVALGYQALATAVGQNNNIAIGALALTGTVILSDNIAIGVNALSNISNNVGQQIAIGSGALQNNTTGIQNIAVGHQALNANTSGLSNAAFGLNALSRNTTGYGNLAVGR